MEARVAAVMAQAEMARAAQAVDRTGMDMRVAMMGARTEADQTVEAMRGGMGRAVAAMAAATTEASVAWVGRGAVAREGSRAVARAAKAVAARVAVREVVERALVSRVAVVDLEVGPTVGLAVGASMEAAKAVACSVVVRLGVVGRVVAERVVVAKAGARREEGGMGVAVKVVANGVGVDKAKVCLAMVEEAAEGVVPAGVGETVAAVGMVAAETAAGGMATAMAAAARVVKRVAVAREAVERVAGARVVMMVGVTMEEAALQAVYLAEVMVVACAVAAQMVAVSMAAGCVVVAQREAASKAEEVMVAAARAVEDVEATKAVGQEGEERAAVVREKAAKVQVVTEVVGMVLARKGAVLMVEDPEVCWEAMVAEVEEKDGRIHSHRIASNCILRSTGSDSEGKIRHTAVAVEVLQARVVELVAVAVVVVLQAKAVELVVVEVVVVVTLATGQRVQGVAMVAASQEDQARGAALMEERMEMVGVAEVVRVAVEARAASAARRPRSQQSSGNERRRRIEASGSRVRLRRHMAPRTAQHPQARSMGLHSVAQTMSPHRQAHRLPTPRTGTTMLGPMKNHADCTRRRWRAVCLAARAPRATHWRARWLRRGYRCDHRWREMQGILAHRMGR